MNAIDLVTLERDERGVVMLTLNRPQAFNALSEGMLAALAARLEQVAADATARVVVLRGAGRAFCAGHDLKEMLQHGPQGRAVPVPPPEGDGSPGQAGSTRDPSQDYYERLFAQCTAMMLAIQRLPVPVVARVHGIATAAGCQLVAMCDLAVAASDARFAVSGINVGLFCSTPSVPLSRNLSRKAAFEMLVTGEFIGAEEARAKGLVNRVAPPDQLDAEVERLAASIVAKPRVSIAAGKALFYRQLETGIAAAYQDAGQTMACNMMTPEALEGVQAFIDKRAPNWG